MISICIPINQTKDTSRFLARSLTSISQQTFTDYEVVITDEGNFARNHNAAIQRAKGDIIQMLQMDDYFSDGKALQRIYDGFTEDTVWQISGSLHDSNGQVGHAHMPYWTDDIYTGNNRLGSVSTLSMRRETALQFEEPLTWLVDVEMYYRLFLKFGPPKINKYANVTIDVRTDRLSHTLPNDLKVKEVEYVTKKYGK